MKKHIISFIAFALLFGMTSCQPDVIDNKKTEESTIETPTKEEIEEPEEESPVEPSIDDWKDGSHSSTDLTEK